MSSLRAQLNTLAAEENKTIALGKSKTVSILFDLRSAANVSIDKIHELALEGLEELSKMDGRFSPFASTLLNESSKSFERNLQTKEVNENLDKSIHSLLRLLSNYFLLKPTHKILEYLLRRYRIHKYNVNSIMCCILPYHETPMFGKIVGFLKFINSPWAFLAKCRKASAPLNHLTLIEACLHNGEVVQAICENIKDLVDHKCCSKTTLSFYGVTLTQVVSSNPHIDDSFLQRILPFIFSGIKSNNLDYQLATYMVISEISARTPLSISLLDSLFDSIIKHIGTSIQDGLLCVAYLCQTQKISKFKIETIKLLISLEKFLPTLHIFIDNKYDLENFFSSLLAGLVANCFSDDLFFKTLEKIILEIPISSHISPITNKLLTFLISQQSNNPKTINFIYSLLKTISNRYPKILDAELNSQLASERSPQERKRIFEFVSSSFVGSKYQVLEASQTTLFFALEHPEPEIRLLALQTLIESSSNLKTESDKEFLIEALSQRLSDENLKILETLLSVDLLMECPPEPTLKKLTVLLFRPISDKLKEKILKVLVLKFLPKHPTFKVQVSSILFPYLLQSKFSGKLNSIGIELCKKVNFSLFNNMDKSQSYDSKFIISTLSNNLLSYFENLFPTMMELSKSNHLPTKILAFLIINKAFYDATNSDIKLCLAESLIAIVLEEIETLSSRINLNIKYQQDFIKSEDGIPESRSLEKLGESELKRSDLFHYCLFSIKNVLSLPCDFNEINWLIPLNQMGKEGSSQRALAIFYRIFMVFALRSSIPKGVFILQDLFRILGNNFLKFLSTFWINDESESNITVLVKSFHFAAVYITSLNESLDLQLLLPALLIPLNSTIESVRSSSILCIEKIVQNYSKNPEKKELKTWGFNSNGQFYGVKDESLETLEVPLYFKFTQFLIKRKNEIISDHTYLQKLISLLFTESPKEHDFSKLESHSIGAYLVSHATALTPYGKYAILSSMSQIKIASKLMMLHPLLQNYLDSITSLSSIETKILQLILSQFSEETVSIMSPSKSEYFESFIQILSIESLRACPVKEQLISQITQTFFDTLCSENQIVLFGTLCQIILNDEAVALQAKTLLKKLQMNASLFVDLIKRFLPPKAKKKTSSKKQKSSSQNQSIDPSQIILKNLPKINLTLEILLAKTSVKNEIDLIPHLFEVLSIFSSVQDPQIEYTKQITLENITQLVERMDYVQIEIINPKNKKKKSNLSDLEKKFQLETAIDCLKQSSNPQTHNNVILLLASLGPFFPSLILKHAMTLFTFMGTSSVQQDDNYTFYVTQKAIQHIVPAILQHGQGAKPVLEIFVKNFDQIPAHRKLLLFQTIIKTVSAKDYLFPIFVLFFVKHAQDSQVPFLEPISKTNIPNFLHDICRDIDILEVAKALEQLTLFGCFKDNFMKDYYDPSNRSIKEITFLKLSIIEFITDQITSPSFLDKILHIPPLDQVQTQPIYLSMLESFLLYLNESNTKAKEGENKGQWNEIAQASYTAVESVNQLLNVKAFSNAISKLLQHTDAQIRKRALILLNDKISGDKEDYSPKDISHFVGMLGNLGKILSTSGKEEELDINKQTSLLCLEILARHLAAKQPESFVALVPSIINSLRSTNEQVVSSSAITLATFVLELGPSVIPHVAQFYPTLLKALQNSEKSKSAKSRALIRISILSSLEVIISQIAQFLSPYLSQTLNTLIEPKLLTNETKNEQIQKKIKVTLEKLSQFVAPRLLIPIIHPAYKAATTPQGIILVLDFFGSVCSKMDFSYLQTNYKLLLKIFLNFFDCRHKRNNLTSSEISQVELHCIKAFLALTVKLNENMFRPMFLKIVEWSQETQDEEKKELNRRPFFYHLMSSLSEKLKGIVVPYFGSILNDCVTQLNQSSDFVLLRWILSSLQKCFLYDTEGFINKEKFDKLLHPLVNLITKAEQGKEGEKLIFDHLVPCISQLAVCIGNETLWKPLNYQVMLRSSHASPKVRLASIKIAQEFYSRLGEEFLILLPETIPYISELMEDQDPEVEQQCQKLISQIEVYLGEESLASYF